MHIHLYLDACMDEDYENFTHEVVYGGGADILDYGDLFGKCCVKSPMLVGVFLAAAVSGLHEQGRIGDQDKEHFHSAIIEGDYTAVLDVLSMFNE